MKANQSSRHTRNDKGEVGIGTMIVFIAAVIVAAIAAAVLVNTAGNLERKASETGSETTQEVSGNIFVRGIDGTLIQDGSSNQEIEELNVTISLAPGADPIDLSEMVIRYQTEDLLKDVTYNDNGEGQCKADSGSSTHGLDTGFCVVQIEEQGSGGTETLEAGDRVRLNIALDDSASTDETLGLREEVDILLMPETGTPVHTGFETPNAWPASSTGTTDDKPVKLA